MGREIETCENCGRTIGKLETPYLHKDYVVCAECADRLSAARSYDAPVDSSGMPQVTVPPLLSQTRRGKTVKVVSIVAALVSLPVGTVGLAANSPGIVAVAALAFFGGFLGYAACRIVDEIRE